MVVRQGDTLRRLAARYGTTVQELTGLNGLKDPNRIYPGQVLQYRLYGLTTADGPFDSEYEVRRGDSLSRIAARLGVSVRGIERANELPRDRRIYPGQVLKIPPVTGRDTVILPAQALENCYVVQRGDTLWTIARRFDRRVDTLRQANGLLHADAIYPGQVLALDATPISAGMRHFVGGYVVQRGDTLWTISRRFGVTAGALYRANDLRDRDRIYPGQILRIPRE